MRLRNLNHTNIEANPISATDRAIDMAIRKLILFIKKSNNAAILKLVGCVKESGLSKDQAPLIKTYNIKNRITGKFNWPIF